MTAEVVHLTAVVRIKLTINDHKLTIKERNKKIKSAKKVECKGCNEGKQMCKTRPCWGTVDDFKRIIDAGHADKLMIDYYNNASINGGNNIYFLSGASNHCQGSKAIWNPKGTCIFFEKDKLSKKGIVFTEGKCLIHDIKPTIGAVACCKKRQDKEFIHACLLTWTTRKGKKLISDWKKMVNYVDVPDNEGFNFVDAFMLMAGF